MIAIPTGKLSRSIEQAIAVAAAQQLWDVRLKLCKVREDTELVLQGVLVRHRREVEACKARWTSS